MQLTVTQRPISMMHAAQVLFVVGMIVSALVNAARVVSEVLKHRCRQARAARGKDRIEIVDAGQGAQEITFAARGVEDRDFGLGVDNGWDGVGF